MCQIRLSGSRVMALLALVRPGLTLGGPGARAKKYLADLALQGSGSGQSLRVDPGPALDPPYSDQGGTFEVKSALAWHFDLQNYWDFSIDLLTFNFLFGKLVGLTLGSGGSSRAKPEPGPGSLVTDPALVGLGPGPPKNRQPWPGLTFGQSMPDKIRWPSSPGLPESIFDDDSWPKKSNQKPMNSDDKIELDPDADEEVDELADDSDDYGQGRAVNMNLVHKGTTNQQKAPPPQVPVKAKRPRGRPPGSKNKPKPKPNYMQEILDEIVGSPTTSKLTKRPCTSIGNNSDEETATSKKKKCAQKDSSDEETVEEPLVKYTAYIEVSVPAPQPAGRTIGSRAKIVVPPPTEIQKGPIRFDAKTSFPEFISAMAAALPYAPANFPTAEAKWQFEVPKASSKKPVQNEAGFETLLQALDVSASKKTPCTSIFVSIPPPSASKEPWDTGDGTFVPTPYSHGYETSAMNPETSFDGSAKATMSSMIDYNNEHLGTLQKKYPAGSHPRFPGKRILVLNVAGQDHYLELTDLRLKIWAMKLSANTSGVSLDQPPNSNHFNISHCIKLAKEKENIDPIAAHPQMSYPPHYYPYHQAPLYPPPVGYPPSAGYPPFPPPAHGHPPAGAGYGYLQPGAAAGPSRSYQLPLPSPRRNLPKMMLQELCAKYDLSDTDHNRLEQLEYCPGDRGVEGLEKNDFVTAGFTVLSWGRLLEAHHHYLRQRDD
ncbi:hypothetical protein BKA70DRAFT_1225861 [Coprinopsis sp. MPI-PUGE-AT-0042]|nr:hypothetical protein BKA70DRAFT_1225861 [Coprinopsis sp. MPI-PUGE-AT-0042]